MSQACSQIGQRYGTDFPQQVESVTHRERFERVVQKIHSLRGSDGSTTIGGVILVHDILSVNLTLADLRVTEGSPLREKLIEHLELGKSIAQINQYFPFFERLKKVGYEVLEQVSLYSLQLVQVMQDPKKSAVADALLEEEALIEIPVQELRGRQDLKVFAFRMHQIYREQPDLLARFAGLWMSESLQMPAMRVGLLSAGDILKIRDKLPTEAFGLLTDDQVKSLDFSGLSPEQIESCIRGGINDEETIQRRFSMLSDGQLAIIFTKVKNDDLLSLFPVASFGRLPVAAMTKELIERMFCSYSIPENEQKRRIAMLSPEAVSAILPKLGRDFLLKLSDEQIRGLDYSKVGKQQLEDIFCSWNLSGREKSRRIALIPPRWITQLVKIAESDFLIRLTNEQILSLDLDSLDRKLLEDIFFNIRLNEGQRRARIALLPALAINRLIQRCFFDVLECLSDEQLAQVDLSNIPQEYIELLFPSLNPANFHPGYEYSVEVFMGQKRHKWTRETDGGFGQRGCDDSALAQEISEKKAVCRKNFRVISQQQFADIKGKISPEVLEFLHV